MLLLSLVHFGDRSQLNRGKGLQRDCDNEVGMLSTGSFQFVFSYENLRMIRTRRLHIIIIIIPRQGILILEQCFRTYIYSRLLHIQGAPYISGHYISSGLFPSVKGWIWPPNLICLAFRVLLICRKSLVAVSWKLWIFF